MSELYLIISNPQLSYREIGEICVQSEIPFLQLREKHLSDREIFKTAQLLREITNQSKTKLIIDDRLDIALLAKADGVHLGQKDLPIEIVRNFVPVGFIIGYSTHSQEQLQAGLQSCADYLGFGPVWKTPTKIKPDPEVGLAELHRAISISSKPLVAIGGIDNQNITEIIPMQPSYICMVRYFMETINLKQRIQDIKSRIGNKGK